MIRILLADDDTIIREGLKMIMETQDDFEVVACVDNGKQAVDAALEKKPDVVLMDIRMPVMDGIEAAEKIMENNCGAPLLLTTFDEDLLMQRAIRTGVRGYILKNSPAQRIISAIRTVSLGGTVFQEDVLEYIKKQVTDKKDDKVLEDLSEREREIVKLIAEGLSNKEISQKLFLSEGTVRNHISTILEKTNLEHRTQLAIAYLKG